MVGICHNKSYYYLIDANQCVALESDAEIARIEKTEWRCSVASLQINHLLFSCNTYGYIKPAVSMLFSTQHLGIRYFNMLAQSKIMEDLVFWLTHVEVIMNV